MSTTTASEAGPGGAARRTRVILAIILASYFMILLDKSVIFTGLTKIQAPATVTALAAGVALLIVLVTGEARAAQPIMPLRLFASCERVGGYLTRMLYMAAMMGFFFFTSQYMQGVLGFSALLAGLGFLPMTAVNFGVAMAIPRVTARLGQAVPLAASAASSWPSA